ncbi:MAG: single-stranded DNA-binding protein [Mycobacteriaceae bacterium]|uniref:single-stranded DNA-binding protein n=1 Tax=Corynebacterium sp. TaxID=1720 RepID=UPI003F95DE06
MATQQMSVTMTGFAASHPARHDSIEKLVTFRMASTPSWNDNGVWKDSGTLFIDVQAWGKLGDNVMASVVKGAPLVIAGRMSSYTFRPEDGPKNRAGEPYAQTIWRLNASNVGLDLSHSTSTWSLRGRVKEADVDGAENSQEEGKKGLAGAGYPGSSQGASSADPSTDPDPNSDGDGGLEPAASGDSAFVPAGASVPY